MLRRCLPGFALLFVLHAASAADAPAGAPDGAPEAAGDLATICPKPDYPLSILDSKAEGTSVVILDVGESGKVIGSQIKGRSGRTPAHRLLDRAAQDAYEACKFDPAPGVPHRTRRVEYTWAFHSKDEAADK